MQANNKYLIALSFSAALLASACGKSTDEGSPTSAGGAPNAAKAAPAATLVATAIKTLGAEIDVPAESMVTENSEMSGVPGATIYASPTIFIQGESDSYKLKDMAAMKKEIEKQPGNTFKSYSKEDGADAEYQLEFELNSMMDEPLYGFQLRVTRDDKSFLCSTNSDSTEERSRAIAMCKSLRLVK